MLKIMVHCTTGNQPCGRICINPAKRKCRIIISPVGAVLSTRGTRANPTCSSSSTRCYGAHGSYCISSGKSCGGRPRGTRGNPLCRTGKHCPSASGLGGYCIPQSSFCRAPVKHRRRYRVRSCKTGYRVCGRSCIRKGLKCHKRVGGRRPSIGSRLVMGAELAARRRSLASRSASARVSHRRFGLK